MPNLKKAGVHAKIIKINVFIEAPKYSDIFGGGSPMTGFLPESLKAIFVCGLRRPRGEPKACMQSYILS